MPHKTPEDFLTGKSSHTLDLYQHFLQQFEAIGPIELLATKTMIGISNGTTCIAWVTQLGKNFIHIVFPFGRAYPDNLCFTKIAQVPGTLQFNHHFRMLHTADINDEVLAFMKMAYVTKA